MVKVQVYVTQVSFQMSRLCSRLWLSSTTACIVSALGGGGAGRGFFVPRFWSILFNDGSKTAPRSTHLSLFPIYSHRDLRSV